MVRLVIVLVCVLCVSTVCARSPSERIAQTIGSMQASVLKGDSGAYMALVDTADRKFVIEQRAWFADLSINPVSDFRIEAAGDVVIDHERGLATIPIVVYWTLEDDGIERSISYRALFRALNQNGDVPWFYAGRAWSGMPKVNENGTRVLADAQHKELASGILDVVPEIRSGIEGDLGLRLGEPLTIRVYPTVQELQYSVSLGYLNMLSGWNEPGESIKILGRDSVSAERISSLLAHEIGHAVSFEFGPEIINAPWWSLEGIAEFVADGYRSKPEGRAAGIARQVERGDRRSWEQLSDFKGEALNHSMYVYWQGWSMVRFITQRYGKRARNKWFIEMGNGASVEEATQRVLKISFDDLDMEWESEQVQVAQQAATQP